MTLTPPEPFAAETRKVIESHTEWDSPHLPTAGERDEFLYELMEHAPVQWDGDEAEEAIAIRYVRHLEAEVRRLGGSLDPRVEGDAGGPVQETAWRQTAVETARREIANWLGSYGLPASEILGAAKLAVVAVESHLGAELGDIAQERDQAVREREAAGQNLSDRIAERNDARAEARRLSAEPANTKTDRDALASKLEAAHAAHDRAVAERDLAFSERDHYAARLKAEYGNWRVLAAKYETAEAARIQAVAERDEARAGLDAAQVTPDPTAPEPHTVDSDCNCEPGGVDRCEYRILADAVAEAFNPPGDDEAEVAILARAVGEARDFVGSLPCECIAPDADPSLTCRRCQVLGRAGGEPVGR